MGELEEGIKQLIEQRYDSQAAFARAVGLRPSTVSSFLSRGALNSNASTLKAIVEELDLDANAALDGRFARNDDPSRPVLVPMYGSISAGKPAEPTYAESFVPLPAHLHRRHPDAYILRVDGNSMNRCFPDGSYLLVEPCSDIGISGERYVVSIGDEDATVKQVVLHDKGMMLHPESDDPSYEDAFFRYDDPQAETVRVRAKVLYSFSPVDLPRPAPALAR